MLKYSVYMNFNTFLGQQRLKLDDSSLRSSHSLSATMVLLPFFFFSCRWELIRCGTLPEDQGSVYSVLYWAHSGSRGSGVWEVVHTCNQWGLCFLMKQSSFILGSFHISCMYVASSLYLQVQRSRIQSTTDWKYSGKGLLALDRYRLFACHCSLNNRVE